MLKSASLIVVTLNDASMFWPPSDDALALFDRPGQDAAVSMGATEPVPVAGNTSVEVGMLSSTPMRQLW